MRIKKNILTKIEAKAASFAAWTSRHFPMVNETPSTSVGGVGLLILCMASMSAFAQDYQKDFKNSITSYFENYPHANAKIDRIKLQSLEIDTDSQTVKIVAGGGFQEQCFTSNIVDSIYKDIRSFLPEEIHSYNVSLYTENHLIEDLVPNFFRKKNKDKTRLLKKEYTGAPWITNVSKPYKAIKGLEGTHIALWPSHGRYYKQATKEWTWQRPRLFCTNEDLFSQSFVNPYIIPMLQNAGAIVFTPRERDWQTNEVVIDNDTPVTDGYYIEHVSNKSRHMWASPQSAGFANYKPIYAVTDTPFVDGTSRYIASTTDKANAHVQWVPNIPKAGRYAVYVTYHSFDNSVHDAHYKVMHKGGVTEFKVNQKMGGGTWVYLGTFDFEEGVNENSMVILSNHSSEKGIVSADAVRFGGGKGNVVPLDKDSIPVNPSGFARWAEAAKYSTFWYGMPYSIHTGGFGADEYNNDINSRSRSINYLCGGSVYNKQNDGLKVPLEMNIAFHTDAGYSVEDSLVGSLSIYRTTNTNGLTGAGLDRYVSRDLASMLMYNLRRDLKKYNWKIRQLWNRNYGEAREPLTPACILEMLSHQNFADMRLAYDPQFKFDFSRSVYKTIVKFIATEHNRSYVIQPLPVHNFSINLNEQKRTAELSWAPTMDKSVPTSTPRQYVIYIRKGNGAFDNGTVVNGTSHSIALQPDVTYSFKVTALNAGGESFPSEILSAGIASHNTGTILIVNGFTRLESPKVIDTPTEAGFDLDADPGVPYGAYAGYCGRQLSFDRSKAGKETRDGLGYSGSELEGKIVMGNTFDYAYQHGRAIMTTHRHSFTSTSEDALITGVYNLKHFNIVDVIFGVQKEFNNKTADLLSTYLKDNGHLIISGANITPLMEKMQGIDVIGTKVTTDKSIKDISMRNLSFDIFREMNDTSYAIPQLTSLATGNKAFPMLTYSDGSTAGIAYSAPEPKAKTEMPITTKTKKEKKKKKNKETEVTPQIKSNTSPRYIILGFPLESIKEDTKMNTFTRALVKYLEN